jgi:hypothetical protein
VIKKIKYIFGRRMKMDQAYDNIWFWFPSTTNTNARGSIANSKLNTTGHLWYAAVIPPVILQPGFYTSQTTVTITTETAYATIYYTTDGTTPTLLSNVYIGPFNIYHSQMIKAIAVRAGFDTSTVTSGYFTIMSDSGGPLLCWQFTARKKDGRVFQLNGDGKFPEVINVPASVDLSTCTLVDEGIVIDPTKYSVVQ